MLTKKKKILFCGELPPAVVHGVSISNLRILRDLNELYDISVVELDSAFKGGLESFKRSLFSMPSLIRAALRDVSIFYTNLPASLIGMLKTLIYIIAVKISSPQTKIFLHIHRGDFISFLDSVTARILFFVIRLFAFRIFVLSKNSKHDLLKYNSSLTSVLYVFKNYVETPNNSSNSDVLNSMNKGFESNRFLCLSNYIPTKGQDGLVSELDPGDGINIVFHGYKSDMVYFNNLVSLDKYSLCEFGDVLFNEDKFTILNRVRALVVTSKNEGMPLVILEAISQGKPVICFDIGYVREYLGLDYPGIVKGCSYADLYNKILWVKKMPLAEYKIFCDLGWKLFLNNYSLIIAKKATLQAFRLSSSL